LNEKNNKIRVFEVIAENKLTGAPRVLLTLMKKLPSNRFEQYLIAPPGELMEAARALGKVTVLPVPMRGRSDLPAARAINRLIAKYNPDIVHAHGSRAGILARIGSFLMHTKTVYTEHTRTSHFVLPNVLLEWAHRIGMTVLDIFNTDATVAVSDSVANFLKRNISLKRKKVIVIPNGIEPAEIRPTPAAAAILKDLGLTPEDKIIGTIGSLNPAKDHKTLLEAFVKVKKSFKDAKLLLIGEGPLKVILQKYAQRWGVGDDVIFAGYQEDAASLIPYMDIFVLPSKTEAFGLAILEAMQAGVPIIATRVGGIPEVIHHNHNGLLVPYGDVHKLAASINLLLNDKKLARKIINNYPETLARFTADKMAKAHTELYERLAKMPAIKSV
jgi:glycosyltransferase involved in cell wall biosynthesis